VGWESGISLGASAVSAFANTENAVAQSKGIAQTAENQATNLANKTSRNIGSLETSFLKGGIALTGTGGPAAVFQQAGQQGITDISRTISNANASIEDTMNKARTQSLNTIASGFSKLGAGTIQAAVGSAWNGLTGNPDPTPTGFGSGVSMTGTGQVGSGIDWGLSY
jgi:hypothetical protein